MKFQIPNSKFQNSQGFTLVEMLVVIAVLSIVGTLILNIFTRTLQGNNKAQLIELIKQNGQSILEIMDKTIRNADHVICLRTSNNPTIGSATIVVVKDGAYTMFRYTQPQPANDPLENGWIETATFNLPATHPEGTDEEFYVTQFDRVVCNLQTGNLSANATKITDTNPQKGISVSCKDNDCNLNPIFSKEVPLPGYRDIVKIKFALSAGVGAPEALKDQIDPVDFQTTIQLR